MEGMESRRMNEGEGGGVEVVGVISGGGREGGQEWRGL